MIYQRFFVREEFKPKDGENRERLASVFEKNLREIGHEDFDFFYGHLAWEPYILAVCDTKEKAEKIQKVLLDTIYKEGLEKA